MKGHGQKSELELQEKLDQVLRRMESLELRFGSGRRATVNYRCYSSNREGHIRPFVKCKGGVNGEQEMTQKLMNQSAGTANGIRHHSRYVVVILVTPRCAGVPCPLFYGVTDH